MRAVEVKVHNFRSIIDGTICLQDLSLMAGPNNSGKSNVIDAIRMFYDDYRMTDADIPKTQTSDEDTWVEVEIQPSADELDQLKDEYRSPDGTFRVRNYIRSASKAPDGKKRAGYYAYVDGELSDTLFYGAKNVGSGKVGSLIYIPAVSKIDDHTKLTGPSSLRELVANVLSKVVDGSRAYESLTEAFTEFTGSVRSQTSPEGHSLDVLETEVTKELSSWEAQFKLDIQAPKPADLVKTLVHHELIDEAHGGEIDQARFGAGFQRSLIFVLIKLNAKFTQPTKKAAEKKEFSPELSWILFEEPEAFLHASQEEMLYESLRKIASSDGNQVLVTTHSAQLVSSSIDDLTRLVRLRRDKGVTSVHQVSQDELASYFDGAHMLDAEIDSGLAKLGDIDRQKLMSAMKMEVWLQPSRSAAFLAESVMLVEGVTEVALYSYLRHRGLIPAETAGLIVVDCMGKYNIHRFVSLLNAFGIDHVVLYDGDDGKKVDAEVTSAIGSSRGAYTHDVVRLATDLESELGIKMDKGIKNSAKPQYVLYHLEAGLVDEGRIADFTKRVADMCLKIAPPAEANT